MRIAGWVGERVRFPIFSICGDRVWCGFRLVWHWQAHYNPARSQRCYVSAGPFFFIRWERSFSSAQWFWFKTFALLLAWLVVKANSSFEYVFWIVWGLWLIEALAKTTILLWPTRHLIKRNLSRTLQP